MPRHVTPATYTGDPYRRLVGAIVLQAIIEAKRGNPMALAWLGGDDAALYLDYCRLDYRKVESWLTKQKIKARP